MTQKRRILIVDDDPDFSAAIQKILLSANYQVDLAGNVEDGMKTIKEKRTSTPPLFKASPMRRYPDEKAIASGGVLMGRQ